MVVRTSLNKVPVIRKILLEEDSEEKFVIYNMSEKRPRKVCGPNAVTLICVWDMARLAVKNGQ